ncbi:MAG: sulfotransferase family 2 domain-containing protein [Anaerolineales bacterium]|nr:sulfotransferase family 2 domain-containing protein [Anaerolineales bacterium]
MAAKFKNHKVIFLHIPKTAGTTLNTILKRQYPASRRASLGALAQQDIARFKSLSEAERARIKMLNGHLAYGLHDYMVGPTTYFTILREPIDRIVSFYYFVYRNPHHYLYDFTHRTNLGLRGYLENKNTIMVDNFQTRLISGIWDTYPFGELPPTALEQAKENLRNHFAVVGLTEHFDETLLLLRNTFGWRNIFYTPQNVTSNRPERDSLDTATIDAVTAANQMDVELYAFAKSLFADQLAKQGPTFPNQLKSFQATNRLIAPLLRTYDSLRHYSVRVHLREKWESRHVANR